MVKLRFEPVICQNVTQKIPSTPHNFVICSVYDNNITEMLIGG